jgi:hypothetical protein
MAQEPQQVPAPAAAAAQPPRGPRLVPEFESARPALTQSSERGTAAAAAAADRVTITITTLGLVLLIVLLVLLIA